MDRELRRPPGFTRAFIELWDETFDTSYFAVRQALKDIALRNFAAVRGAQLLTPADIGRWPPARVALFSDDDDFFAPHAVEHLIAFAKQADGITWISTENRGDSLVQRSEILCFTNNYAVTARPHLGRAWVERILRHGRATRTFRARGFRSRHLPLKLSVTNQHPASALTIRNALEERPGRDGLVALLESFNRKTIGAASPPVELAWAAEAIADLAEIFSQVRLR